MQLAEVGGKTGLSPVGRIGTVPSAWIVVMTVNIGTTGFSRDEEANCSGLVVYYLGSVGGKDNKGVRRTY